MSSEQKAPIVVKRIQRKQHQSHGGMWKVAYADFVTAMMAFFLLMWLLGSTTRADLKGIADYFNTPLKVALGGGSGTGDSSSVIQGGGTDLTRSVGQRKQGDLPTEKKVINLKAAQAELERLEQVRLTDLKSRVERAIEANATLRNFKKQLRVDMTNDGLRIQIVDEQNRPMFDSGQAVVKSYMRDIIREIATVINTVPNRISLSGHTDAAPFAAGERGYSNWELSADRANASRRELIAGGIEENKIMRVVGLGPAAPLDAADRNSPINRRISIIILNQRAERRIVEDGITAESATSAADVGSAIAAPATSPASPAPATH